MITGAGSTHAKYPALRDLSPGAQAAVHWFRQLARGLRASRLYKDDNPIAVRIRQQLHDLLNHNLETHGAWRLRITPIEIFLVDEPVIRPSGKSDADLPSKEEHLPFLFYRDGIRGLTFLPEVPSHDFEAFFDALQAAGSGPLAQDDLVTLLWQANPVKIQVEALPPLQTIHLSAHRPQGGPEVPSSPGLAYSWSPSGSEIHADIGQIAGAAQGLHIDTFDDWPLPDTYVDVPAAYAALTKGMEFLRSVLVSEWSAERSAPWTSMVPNFFRAVHALDPGPQTRGALSRSLVTWVVSAVQRCSWREAQEALMLLREFDPDGALAGDLLATGISGLDAEDIAERLDESPQVEQSQFFALAVTMGRPALELGCAVLARARKGRTRAAVCTMLCYLCGDQPELLRPYVTDPRWYVVRNAVFVLGQIGGARVAGLLRLATAHPDPRVRRQVVLSLGNVPPAERLPILVSQLHTEDPRVLSATLSLLDRDRCPEAVQAVLRQIQTPNFESRAPQLQRLMFHALAELADDEAIPALAAMLHKGGWLARPTPQRLAAAQALRRMGTEKALEVLEQGLRSGADAVRAACLEALAAKGSE